MCGHWQSEYDASDCSYCEMDRKSWERVGNEISELKKQLSVAKIDASMAKIDATVQSKACAEEMLKREAMEKNWSAMVDSIKQHYVGQLRAETELLKFRNDVIELLNHLEDVMGDANFECVDPVLWNKVSLRKI